MISMNSKIAASNLYPRHTISVNLQAFSFQQHASYSWRERNICRKLYLLLLGYNFKMNCLCSRLASRSLMDPPTNVIIFFKKSCWRVHKKLRNKLMKCLIYFLCMSLFFYPFTPMGYFPLGFWS